MVGLAMSAWCKNVTGQRTVCHIIAVVKYSALHWPLALKTKPLSVVITIHHNIADHDNDDNR